MRGFGFGDEIERMLVLVALYKIQAVLERGLRLRTARDLEVTKLTVKRPQEFVLINLSELEQEVKAAVAADAVTKCFIPSRITEVTWQPEK